MMDREAGSIADSTNLAIAVSGTTRVGLLARGKGFKDRIQPQRPLAIDSACHPRTD